MLKRTFDWLLSLLGIILSFPLWLVISLLIWLEDRSPIFFQQERVGKGGQVIRVIKFRTMKHEKIAHKDIDYLEDDPRVTRIGEFLRAMALDELPQLINILKGDMSFVGPRALPLRIDDDERGKYADLTKVPGFKERAKVRPGLTGISQIYAPKNSSREEKFKYDLEYVITMNFWLDLKLMALSFWITFRGAWEKKSSKL